MTNYVVIARVGAPHGVAGWLKVWPVNAASANFSRYVDIYLQRQDSSWCPTKILACRQLSEYSLIKFLGVADRNAAALLVGQDLAVLRSQLPELAEHEYYWVDLLGCLVKTVNDVSLGVVAYCIDTGANDVLIIKDAAGIEHAIPYICPAVIIAVDLEARVITVDWELL